MKIFSIFVLMTVILLNSVQVSGAEAKQEKVESLKVRINTVESRTGNIIKKIEHIGSKMVQLLKIFHEKVGNPDDKKSVDGKEVVIVTGGVGYPNYVPKETGSVSKSTELYIPETGKSCFFKDLPNERRSHTMDTVDNTAVLCGEQSGRNTNCLQYTPTSPGGAWTDYGRTEGGTRDYHSSWVSSAGLVLLGGSINGATSIRQLHQPRTTEIVPGGGRSFDLKTDSRESCAIQFDDYFVLTGGFFTDIKKAVVQYNLQGYIKNLPDLTEGRHSHGCGMYSGNGSTVMIVAGGLGDHYIKPISSTETMVVGDSAWKTVSPLPGSLSKMAFVSMGQYFLVLGGEFLNEWGNTGPSTVVYKFDGSNWTDAGYLKAPRYGSAATLVRSNELAELCK